MKPVMDDAWWRRQARLRSTVRTMKLLTSLDFLAGAILIWAGAGIVAVGCVASALVLFLVQIDIGHRLDDAEDRVARRLQ
jgi:hypothetical protein